MKNILIYLVCITFLSGQHSHGDVDQLTENFTPEQKQALKDYLNEGVETKENFIAPDFSNVNTEILLDKVLSANMGQGLSYPHIIRELEKRTDELKKLIRARVAVSIPKDKLGNNIMEIKGLPQIAKLVSPEFQIEITKKSLEREGIPKGLDHHLLSYDYLFKILQKSSHDETPVLDRLIEEGRIIKGSKFDRKWRALLSGKSEKTESIKIESGDDLQHPKKEQINLNLSDENKQKEISDKPVTRSENNVNRLNQSKLETQITLPVNEESRFPWIVGGILILVISGLFFFMKGRKPS